MKKSLIYTAYLSLAPFLINAQDIKTIAGTGVAGNSGDGGAAISAELNLPSSVRLDRAGNIYVADQHSPAIRKIDNAGVISTIAGDGTHGYSGDGGPATDALLGQPTDVAIDEAGNIYIADFGYGVIRKINTSGIISTIAGTGVNGYNGDNIPATAAQLYDPLGMVFDTLGNLYFSCNGDWRIREINTSGIISTIVGNGIPGFSGDGGPASSAQINGVGFLAFSPTGDLYIPDESQRVRKIDGTGIITTIAGNGSNSYSGDGGPATNASLMSPDCVVFDQIGNLYISDKNAEVIRKVAINGIITTIAGDGTEGFNGDGGPATDAELGGYMVCSALDQVGNLYIADAANNRIRKITYHSEAVNTVVIASKNITIYPNPTHNEITISYPDNIEGLKITNMLGQALEIPIISMEEKESVMNVASLPGGVYFVRVNEVYAAKFVKE